MILVIGGSFQGKKAFAEQICREEKEQNKQNHRLNIADTYPNVEQQPQILPDFHLQVRKALEAGEDPDALTRKLLENPPEVITLDEAGCGIVPIEREKRIYREAVGRVGQLLAARAEKVYRVQCGIATRIK
ncbi:MAG TPA: adenosylcobinamide kinase [Lachnoclostridium sp.]|nr:adenosylcobinamide kinase [Lachnoclostridium sp.]